MNRCKCAPILSKTADRSLFEGVNIVSPTRAFLPFLQPRHIWGEAICNEILQLIRIEEPGQNWWRNDSVFKNDALTNV